MRFSANKIQTAMNCQRQFMFKYVDEVEVDEVQSCFTSFGKVVHYVLELLDSGTLDPNKAVDLFISAWGDPEKYGIEAPEWYPPRVTYKTLRKKGIESIRRYADSVQWRERQVIAVEHEFLVPCGNNHELYGFVDTLEVTRSKEGVLSLVIKDHKTATKIPNAAALASMMQFTVYDWASYQKEFWVGNKYAPGLPDGDKWFDEVKDLPRLLIWHAVTQGKEVDCGRRTQADYDRMHIAINEISKAVDHNVFVPDISGENCNYCPFKDPCGLVVPDNASKDW